MVAPIGALRAILSPHWEIRRNIFNSKRILNGR
jgi:hypothetical protein